VKIVQLRGKIKLAMATQQGQGGERDIHGVGRAC
jgi:hypothetical protein